MQTAAGSFSRALLAAGFSVVSAASEGAALSRVSANAQKFLCTFRGKRSESATVIYLLLVRSAFRGGGLDARTNGKRIMEM